MPNGCRDDDLSWLHHDDVESVLDSKGPYGICTSFNKPLILTSLYIFFDTVCHAELNAIVNKYSADIRGCRMYVGLFPCNECAKLIIQSGIKEVFYFSDMKKNKDEMKASRKMFDIAGVRCRLIEYVIYYCADLHCINDIGNIYQPQSKSSLIFILLMKVCLAITKAINEQSKVLVIPQLLSRTLLLGFLKIVIIAEVVE